MTVRSRCSLPVTLLVLAILITPDSAAAQTPTVENTIRLRVEQARQHPTVAVRGTRLLQPEAVARFFEARAFAPAWRLPACAQQILAAIRSIDLDGLTPTDYHLAAITAALEAHTKTPATEVTADLQVLIADAAAALIDHVRYGRVRPATLDKRWNVDPRVGTPPLDLALEDLWRASTFHGAAGDGALEAEIETKKPQHFIYTGLKEALARMRAVAKAGGWPAVPAGSTAIKPGAKDARVAIIRKRLLVTGELANATAVEDTVYDADLQAAVKNFQTHHRLSDDGVIGKATLDAMNVSAEARVQQLRVNLERARWVVGGLSDTFVLVNLPAFKAYVIRDRKNVWETRTQIGREARQTPTFRADMKYLVLNPDWTVPPTILAQDVLAGMRKGQNTIAKKRLTILDQQGRTVDPASIDWQNATPRELPLHAAAAARPRQRTWTGQVHLPEPALDFPARHAQPRAVRLRPAHVQLRVYPRRASARAGGRAARTARALEPGTNSGGRRLEAVADRVPDHAAAGADRLLDRLGRRRRRTALREGRLFARPGGPPRARSLSGLVRSSEKEARRSRA